MARRAYTVAYCMNSWSIEKHIDVIAGSKAEAYDKATYEAIPEKEGSAPYSSWVIAVTYSNGNVHEFLNTLEGCAY